MDRGHHTVPYFLHSDLRSELIVGPQGCEFENIAARFGHSVTTPSVIPPRVFNLDGTPQDLALPEKDSAAFLGPDTRNRPFYYHEVL